MIKVVHDTDLGKTHQISNGKLEANMKTPYGFDSYDNGISRIHSWELMDYEEGVDKYRVKQLLWTEGFDVFDKNRYDKMFDAVQEAVKATFAKYPDLKILNTQVAEITGPALRKQNDGKLGLLTSNLHNGPAAISWFGLKMEQGEIPLFINKWGKPDDNFYSAAWRSGVNDTTYLHHHEGASATFHFIVPVPLERIYIVGLNTAMYSNTVLRATATLEDGAEVTFKMRKYGNDFHGYDGIPRNARISKITLQYTRDDQYLGFHATMYKLAPNTKIVPIYTPGVDSAWPSVYPLSYIHFYEDMGNRKVLGNDWEDITSLFTITNASGFAAANEQPIAGAVDIDPNTAWEVDGTLALFGFIANVIDPLNPVHVALIEIDFQSADNLATAVDIKRVTGYLHTDPSGIYTTSYFKSSTTDYVLNVNDAAAYNGVVTVGLLMDSFLTNAPEENVAKVAVTVNKKPATGALATVNIKINAIRIYGKT